MSYRWGADDPETASEVRAAYDLPELPGTDTQPLEGNAAKGFAALAVLFLLAALGLIAALFTIGYLAHAVVAGWNAY